MIQSYVAAEHELLSPARVRMKLHGKITEDSSLFTASVARASVSVIPREVAGESH